MSDSVQTWDPLLAERMEAQVAANEPGPENTQSSAVPRKQAGPDPKGLCRRPPAQSICR